MTYIDRAGFELISHGLSYSITDNAASENWEDRSHQAGYFHGMTLEMSDNGKGSDNDTHIVIIGKKGTRTGTTILVRPKYHQNINELADNLHLSDNVDGDKQVPKKLCMTWWGSSSAGSDTFMLGEVYSEDFGGVDGDCEGAMYMSNTEVY